RLTGLEQLTAPLYLDRDLVGPAVAEGLLDFTGIHRPLEAQWLAGSRSLVFTLAHKLINFLQTPFTAAPMRRVSSILPLPGSSPTAPAVPRKRFRRSSGTESRSTTASSVN